MPDVMNPHNLRIPSIISILSCLPFLTPTESRRQPQLAFFAPCPAPRFDTFTDNILGPWDDYHPTIREETNTKRGEVEEVMRACGGAVQGIREIPLLLPQRLPLPNDSEDGEEGSERLYHNRADDGFLFFDCGSYVSLPKDASSDPLLSKSSQHGDASKNIVCSLSFPKRRSKLESVRTVMTTNPPFVQNLVRSRGNSESNNTEEHSSCNENEVIVPLTSAPESIIWEKGILCRMPSPGQPWMLQRAQWKKYQCDTDEVGEDDASSSTKSNVSQTKDIVETDESPRKIESWISTFSLDEKNDGESNLSWSLCNGKYDTNLRNNLVVEGTTTTLQMGSYCRTTNEVKAMLCFYGENCELKGVSLQEGYIKE